MKHILVLDTGWEWGGGTNSLLELLRRIDRKHFKFTALFYHNYEKPGTSDIKTEIEKLGIDFLLLGRRHQKITVKFLKEFGRIFFFFNSALRKQYIFHIDYLCRIRRDAANITKLLGKLHIDMLYMNNQPSSNLEGIIAAKNAGITSLLHSRIDTTLNSCEVNAVNSWLTKMICVSDGVKQSFVKQGIDSSKCTVVYNGIDISMIPEAPPDKIRNELGIKEGEVLIGTVGSLVKRKCFSDLIDSVAYLAKDGKFDRIKCVIVGTGPEKENLQKRIQRHRLGHRFILAGFKSNAIDYINAFDVFVLPSEKEGCPRVILEAMLMGKPVIAAKVAGPMEMVAHGKTGFLFQKKDSKELAAFLSDLLLSSSLRQDMGRVGKITVADKYSIETYVGNVTKIFSRVTG